MPSASQTAYSIHHTYMREHLLQQLPLLLGVPLAIKHTDPSAPLETVSSHLQLVHRVDVLHVALDTRSVWCPRCPHVEVLVSACFKVEGIVAAVQVGELVEEVECGFGVEFGVWS